MKTLFIGSLPFSTTEDELERDLLLDFGTPSRVRIMVDHETGRSKGFAFVDLADAAAEAAIRGLNGMGYGGRRLKVTEANPPKRQSELVGRR